jgi:hypothetical protein
MFSSWASLSISTSTRHFDLHGSCAQNEGCAHADLLGALKIAKAAHTRAGIALASAMNGRGLSRAAVPGDAVAADVGKS